MGSSRVSVIDEPLTATSVMVLIRSPETTSKASAPAVVDPRGSLKSNSTCKPSDDTDVDTNVGGVPGTVERFVTEVSDNDDTSLPWRS